MRPHEPLTRSKYTGPVHTTAPLVHKPLVVNVVVVRLFEEEEKGVGIGINSNVVKVEGGDPDTPAYLRGDRVRRDVSDLGSWVSHDPFWLARDETTGP